MLADGRWDLIWLLKGFSVLEVFPYFNTVIYVFLLLGLCILIVPLP
jgi:hypothetical protein